MKYRSYEAYTGQFDSTRAAHGVDKILAGINQRDEKIVTVTSIREGVWVLIVTIGQDD